MRSLLTLAALFFASQPLWAKDFNYEDLVSLVQKNRVNSIEKLLPLLPNDLRSHYTLLYNSQSLQGATYDAPRALLFGSTASLVCAFNGDSRLPGYDDFECMQYRNSLRTFEFRSIRFPSPRNHLSSPQFSKPNQTPDGSIHCTSCHQNDPRPNWEQYPVWPGAYGSADDRMEEDGSDPTERDHYLSFLKNSITHGRYSALTHEAGQAQYPYLLDASQETTGTRPNLQFTRLLGEWMAERNSRILERQPIEIQIAYLLFASSCLSSVSEQNLVDTFLRSDVTDTASLLNFLSISPEAWTQKFRYYESTCTECAEADTTGPYDSNDGDFGLNILTATQIQNDLIQAGKLSAGNLCEQAQALASQVTQRTAENCKINCKD